MKNREHLPPSSLTFKMAFWNGTALMLKPVNKSWTRLTTAVMRISQKHLHCYSDQDLIKYSLKDNHKVKCVGLKHLAKRKCKDLCLCLQDVSGIALWWWADLWWGRCCLLPHCKVWRAGWSSQNPSDRCKPRHILVWEGEVLYSRTSWNTEDGTKTARQGKGGRKERQKGYNNLDKKLPTHLCVYAILPTCDSPREMLWVYACVTLETETHLKAIWHLLTPSGWEKVTAKEKNKSTTQCLHWNHNCRKSPQRSGTSKHPNIFPPKKQPCFL